jgi:NAD(P)-dependent dehydrogenase (short-subunit alcohol dehydrogenase family)
MGRAALGAIDILVNNAAAAFHMPFWDVSAKRFGMALELNVRGPWDLAQRVVPRMRERSRGWILNVSSDTAKHPQGPPYLEFYRQGGAVLYGMTKAALDRISTGLAAELHQNGIAVNSLAPLFELFGWGGRAGLARRLRRLIARARGARAACVGTQPGTPECET